MGKSSAASHDSWLVVVLVVLVFFGRGDGGVMGVSFCNYGYSIQNVIPICIAGSHPALQRETKA